MSTARAILAIIGGGALGVLVAELILGLGPRDAGICIAITSVAVIGIELCRLVERDRARIRRGRQQVWARRDHQHQTDGINR